MIVLGYLLVGGLASGALGAIDEDTDEFPPSSLIAVVFLWPILVVAAFGYLLARPIVRRVRRRRGLL